MLQLRERALGSDIIIIMLRGRESFTCGSVWLTGLQPWSLKTAALCRNYRAQWLTLFLCLRPLGSARDGTVKQALRRETVGSSKKQTLCSALQHRPCRPPGSIYYFFCNYTLINWEKNVNFIHRKKQVTLVYLWSCFKKIIHLDPPWSHSDFHL